MSDWAYLGDGKQEKNVNSGNWLTDSTSEIDD